MNSTRITSAFAVLLALTGPAPSVAGASVRPITGPVIRAKVGQIDTYLWDATQYMILLVRDRIAGAKRWDEIELTGLAAMREHTRAGSGPTLRLKIVYTKTGAVSPVYKVETIAGIEHPLTITAPRTLLASAPDFDSLLKTIREHRQLPNGVIISRDGELPPE